MTDQSPGSTVVGLIVFDFDGTLCDSVDVKTDAFHQLYLDDQGAAFADRVRNYHLANAGASRYDKIAHIEEMFLGHPADSAAIERVAARFSRLVEDAVVAAPLFDGVRQFLSDHVASTAMAIASATPTAELQRIVDRKGIAEFFVAVEGSPASKADILADLSKHFGFPRDRMMMVGDQLADAAAATAFGVDAVMVARPQPWNNQHETFDTFALAARRLSQRARLPQASA